MRQVLQSATIITKCDSTDGAKGEREESGLSGTPGNPGLMAFKNWKECVWKNINEGKDQGLIKVNTFFFTRSLHQV